MAIRIRKIKNKTVALCAAEHPYKKGDIYLDDNVHYALSIKFHDDFVEQGFIKGEKWG